MNTEAKKNLVAALLYITLAVMIVAVVCIAVVSVAKKAKDNLPSEEESQSNTDASHEEQRTEPTPPPETEPTGDVSPTPADNNSSDTTDNTPSTPSNEPVDGKVDETLPDKFVVPANGYVSKAYDNEMPVYSLTMNDYRVHDGIDVACNVDSEVYACAAGTVESIYEDPLMGHAVTVYHGGGLRSTYLNLSGVYPENLYTGAEVAAGQVIGYVGESSLIECAEVPHLHFAMTMDEAAANPLDYVVYEGAVSIDEDDFVD